VIVGNANGPLTTERVTKAYYVTTHADLPQTAASGRWTDRQLTITPTSLGAVRVGMPFDQAQQAAGITFNSGGDGYTDYGRTNPAYPQLWIGGGNAGTAGSTGYPVRCVGAGGTPTAQAVVTPEGFHLGDSIQTLLSVYGSRATYVPAPTQGGITDNAGYVVSEPTGHLVFILDYTGHHISAIAGGPSSLGPNGCTG
jgi:hypothetical protein